ncbi:MAG: SagB/ThcOx family dehydrogenase [Thaumarchaeota archaeon]|nr:SagB/ThcOx family dehydrogenase [Nitrososphaerota archaeon]
MNSDIRYTIEYHETTKHSEMSIRTSARYLDWENKPSPFKVYRNLPSVSLPRDFPTPKTNAFGALIGGEQASRYEPFDIDALAEILFFSAGLTRKMDLGGDTYYMRAAPATGALYPIELYVISREIPNLGAGVYHFNPLEFALVRLREGDYRKELASMSSDKVLNAPFTIAYTSLAWRNAWKYDARSYRHWFWDGGAMAANLLAVSNSKGLRTKIMLGFLDSDVNTLLGIDGEKEATMALAPVGIGLGKNNTGERKDVAPLHPEVVQDSKETEYKIIWETHKASYLETEQEVRAWAGTGVPRSRSNAQHGAAFDLKPPEEVSRNLDEAILQRGSTRRFARQPISLEKLSAILQASSTDVPFDFAKGRSLVDIYLIVNDVTGLPRGSYFFDSESNSLLQLKAGEFRKMSGYLCLEQPLFIDASIAVYLMTDLKTVLGSLGNRGYRACQFEAGVRAGNIYLSAYSLGIGASGSTFYDDAVTEFFSPHAGDKSTMIALGVGVPAYKAKPGRILPQIQ